MVLVVALVVLLALSGVAPCDRFTWVLEVAPILVGVPVLVTTASRFPLTLLTYRLMFAHAVILMLGGHYTYAEVPLGFWAQEAFGFARNHHDRLGHFAQGFVPANVPREILLRRTPLRAGGWLLVLVTAVALAISALYELVEWWAALLTGEAARAFLGTQGDPWDTSGTCFWRWSARSRPSWRSRVSTTDSSQRHRPER
jgi:putative membrane protein